MLARIHHSIERTYGRVDKTDGRLPDSKTSVVDGGEDRRRHRGRCGRAVDEVEFALYSNHVVRAVFSIVKERRAVSQNSAHPLAEISGKAREPEVL